MEVEPTLVDEHLETIYRGLPDATLEAEEARLRVTVADLAGKLIVIGQIRGTE